MAFQRQMSLMAVLLTAIGGIVGSGWLFGPLFVAQIAGPAAIVAWLIGGGLMTIINFTWAELAADHPVAGGMVQLAEDSHGALMSFTVGWLIWLASVAVAPVETLALLQYVNNYWPGLLHTVQGAAVLTTKGLLAAAALLLLMTLINFYSVKIFSKMSNAMVIIKLLVPILVIIVFWHVNFQGSNFTQFGGFMPYGWHGIFAALPLGGIIFSFLGNTPAIQMAAEARNPKIALPVAIIGSVAACAILYILLQSVFIGALGAHHLQEGWGAVKFTGQTGPFAAIAVALGLGWLVWLIYADAFISPFGTAFIYTAATGRINYALARIQFFPALFSRLNRHGVPAYALLCNYLLGLLMFLPFPDWQKMVGFVVSGFVVAYAVGPLALMPLRKKHTLAGESRFRLPCGHIFAIGAFTICNLMVYWTGWDIVRHLLTAVLIGLAVFAYRWWRYRQHFSSRIGQTAKWLIPYLLGIGIITYSGAYGDGRNWLPFGIDMVVVLLFSIVIYGLAMRYARVRENVSIAEN